LLVELAGLAGPDASLEEIIRLPGSWTEPTDPWMASAIGIAAGITGANDVMGAVPFNTDGSLLAPAYGGIPSLILGPGEPGQAHQTDEWCEVARIEEAAAIYLELMRRFTPPG
jgi:succinyl-diaminopimelate desuccinylase